jgi:hypothetical protein
MADFSDEIDILLEHYLHLLDQYTTLRNELNTIQSSIHQHMARANFSADRGIRYGQDFYDERMQASRRCTITPSNDIPSFAISTQTQNPLYKVEEKEGNVEEEDKSAKLKDPIRMFGILTPQHLRIAQSESIKTVETIIPRLVSTDADMRGVEIQIRRARKRKAKTEVAEKKVKEEGIKEVIAR